MVHYRSADAGGHRVFYREAGDPIGAAMRDFLGRVAARRRQ
jgi:hypothetical protein